REAGRGPLCRDGVRRSGVLLTAYSLRFEASSLQPFSRFPNNPYIVNQTIVPRFAPAIYDNNHYLLTKPVSIICTTRAIPVFAPGYFKRPITQPGYQYYKRCKRIYVVWHRFGS